MLYPVSRDSLSQPEPASNVKDDMIELKMDNRWITDHKDTWFYTGNRLLGMDEAQDLHRVVMKNEVTDGQNVWVVDILREKGKSSNAVGGPRWNLLCAGCREVINL